MQGYRLLLVAGCWLTVFVTSSFEFDPTNTAPISGDSHLSVPSLSACRREVRKFYRRKHCPNRPTIRKAFCPVVQCPTLTCLERSFLKTEQEILALKSSVKRPGTVVRVRRVRPGTKIRLRSKREKASTSIEQVPNPGDRLRHLPIPRVAKRGTTAGGARLRKSLGCDNYLDIRYGPHVKIVDAVTNGEYLLLSVPASCGDPLYQPVLTGGCLKNTCCNGDGHCSEVYHQMPYLVRNSDGHAEVMLFNVILYCNCHNST